MQLRQWQKACFNAAIRQYSNPNAHFLCIACPGAGKTTMASVVAAHLLKHKEIDLIVCFSPSSAVSRSFKLELEKQTKGNFDGAMGSVGVSYTFHKMLSLPNSFWQLFEQKRVFVILDEIHHCAGLFEYQANSWGAQLLHRVKDKAHYTMALSGTPWRSDELPVSLSEYCDDGVLIHGYIYNLKRAICEGVCRVPQIVILDNSRVNVRRGDNEESYASLTDALEAEPHLYRDFIYNAAVYEPLIDIAIEKLNVLKTQFSAAGGLIVAGSIEHAFRIQRYLTRQYQINAIVVTHLQPDALDKIDTYRDSQDPWIVSVGMISEGTDIPRLMVCCYLSLIRTEMYFRQVLGRILRKTTQANEYCYFYMLADPSLTRFAQGLQQEIPSDKLIVKIQGNETLIGSSTQNEEPLQFLDNNALGSGPDIGKGKASIEASDFSQLLPYEDLAHTHHYSFGAFKSQLLALALEL